MGHFLPMTGFTQSGSQKKGGKKTKEKNDNEPELESTWRTRKKGEKKRQCQEKAGGQDQKNRTTIWSKKGNGVKLFDGTARQKKG